MGDKFYIHSAQALANFLCLDQRTFYKAVRGLHSVMWIPDPEDAINSQLQFHHASFQDFLLDPLRASKFTIDMKKAYFDSMKSAIHWYGIDVTRFHINDGRYRFKM
jgi:hypothetical protein